MKRKDKKSQQTTDNGQQIFLLAKKSETPIAESLEKYKIKYVVLRKITFVFIEDYQGGDNTRHPTAKCQKKYYQERTAPPVNNSKGRKKYRQ